MSHLGRISWSSSALFTSKEAELQQKIGALRRLSFLIFCGTTDQFLPLLPNIQERIVDLLKWAASSLLISEVLILYNSNIDLFVFAGFTLSDDCKAFV